VVHREQRHRSIERAVPEGQGLGDAANHGRRIGGALRNHHDRRLDRDDGAVPVLVRSRARAHVDHRGGICQRAEDAPADGGVRPAVQIVPAPEGVVRSRLWTSCHGRHYIRRADREQEESRWDRARNVH
jgi:hypothetical protein